MYLVVYQLDDPHTNKPYCWCVDSVFISKEKADEYASRYANFVVRKVEEGEVLPCAGCYEFADPAIKW